MTQDKKKRPEIKLIECRTWSDRFMGWEEWNELPSEESVKALEAYADQQEKKIRELENDLREVKSDNEDLQIERSASLVEYRELLSKPRKLEDWILKSIESSQRLRGLSRENVFKLDESERRIQELEEEKTLHDESYRSALREIEGLKEENENLLLEVNELRTVRNSQTLALHELKEKLEKAENLYHIADRIIRDQIVMTNESEDYEDKDWEELAGRTRDYLKSSNNFLSSINKEQKENCPDCNGSGSQFECDPEDEREIDTPTVRCPACGGSGVI